MKRKCLAIICVAALVVLFARLRADPLQSASDTPGDVEANQNLIAVLGELRFDGTPLDVAIERLSQIGHVKIVVDWDALEAERVHRDTPVRLTLFDLPLSKALALVLDQAGDQSLSDESVDYVIVDGVVRISTADQLRRAAVVRMYDATDLVTVLRNPPPLNAATGPAIQRTRQEAVDDLQLLIEESVDPSSWWRRGHPGAIGTFTEFGGRLLIKQSRKNHRLIESLLVQLRQILAARARGEKVVGWPIEPIPAVGTGSKP